MVYKRVRGWTSERSLPVQNYHKLDEDIQLFKDCNGKVLPETRIWWPEMTEDNKGSPELSISDQGWRGLTKSCRNWQRVVRIERDQTWLTRADKSRQILSKPWNRRSSKGGKRTKDVKGWQNLVSPRRPSLLVLVSPYLCQPLLAVVSFCQPFLLSWLFPAIDNLWYPMPALVNLCQSLSPPGGGRGRATWQSFVPCHRKYSQSEYKKIVVYSTLLHPIFPSSAAILFPLKLCKLPHFQLQVLFQPCQSQIFPLALILRSQTHQ